MFGDGLPRAFERPLGFLFDGRLSEAERQAVCTVEAIRQAVARCASTFEVVNRDGQARQLTASQIAHAVSISPEWGTFLYLCSQSFRARTVLELGGCAGISGCYLASSEYCERFVTVEASTDLASLAGANIRQVSQEGEVVNALFDDALDEILPALRGGIDLAYIDGHHKYEATLHYFRRLAPHLNEGALVVFDDIHLSEGMWRAWRVIRESEGVAYAVSAGRFGLCLRGGPASTTVHYNLCPYFGCLRVGLRRPALPAPPQPNRSHGPPPR